MPKKPQRASEISRTFAAGAGVDGRHKCDAEIDHRAGRFLLVVSTANDVERLACDLLNSSTHVDVSIIHEYFGIIADY